MSKDAYCPPGQEKPSDDTPIGSMMKGMMKKKAGGKPFQPKKGDSPPANNQQDYVRG